MARPTLEWFADQGLRAGRLLKEFKLLLRENPELKTHFQQHYLLVKNKYLKEEVERLQKLPPNDQK